MKQDYLVSLLEEKNVVVPLMFFKKCKELKISLEEFFFLMYLKDKGVIFSFNPQEMCDELGLKLNEVMVIISSLSDKKLLVIETYKNDKGIVEEKINLSLFFEKFTSVISSSFVSREEISFDDSIFSVIEKEFGRTLSPSEIEFIKAWSSNFNTEVIIEAVREATLNGVSSIRYIDKILYEWDKKGIKSKDDVTHMLTKKNKELKEVVEVFDYDWFEDDLE